MDDLNKDAQLARENYIDVIKGIGIIAVIIGHSEISEEIRKVIYEFHMPLFFILAGYVFRVEKWKNRSIIQFCKAKWKTYIRSYFFLATINLIIVGGIWGGLTCGISKEWIKLNLHYIFWIIYSKGSVQTMPDCTPLWFLTCIFVANVIFFCFIKVKTPKRIIGIVLCGIGGWILYKVQVPKLPWNIDTALTGVVFMELGCVVKKYSLIEKVNWKVALFFGGIGIISIGKTGYIDMGSNQLGTVGWFYVGAISLCIIIISICKKNLKKCRIFARYGRHTILVLGFNYLLKDVYGLIVNKLFAGWSCILNHWVVASTFVAVCFGILMTWIEKINTRKIQCIF